MAGRLGMALRRVKIRTEGAFGHSFRARFSFTGQFCFVSRNPGWENCLGNRKTRSSNKQTENKQIGKLYMKNNQTNNNGKIKTIMCAAALALGGLVACVGSQQIQNDLPTMGQGTGTDCVGTYYAMARMTNSTGQFLLTPPVGTTNGVLQDISGFPAPYASTTLVIRNSDLMTWCSKSTNGISFPATRTDSYQLFVYVNSKTPPPTNNQTMKLQVIWH